MQKIGVYGGAFNPIHNTHLSIAKEALEQFKLDKVLFIPTGDPPHKELSEILAKDRVLMLEAALNNDNRFIIDTREINRAGKSYSYLTLLELKEEFPDDNLYFIMGSDSIDYFSEWRKPETISELASIIVAMRTGDNIEHILSLIDKYNSIYPGDFYLLNHIANGISSSEVRSLVSKDVSDIYNYIPEAVAEYIKDHRLYKTQKYDNATIIYLLDIMKKELKNSRYIHTIGVTYTCSQLANCWGYSYLDAMVAGALHDCAKCISDDKRLEICKKNNINITDIELQNPSLLHSKVGAFWARSKYNIEDEAILHAIEVHTTGVPNMSLLDKILFVADYIEPGRDKAPRLLELRNLAYSDLDMCIYLILSDTVEYLKDNPKAIDKTTIDTYEFYKRLIESR